MLSEVGKNYLRLLKAQATVIQNNDLYSFVFYELNPVIGSTESLLTVMSSDREEYVYALIESYENKMLTYMERNIRAVNVLKNITVSQNLLSGFTIIQYNEVVNYMVITYWKTIFGQIINSKEEFYDDDKPNKEQMRVIDLIYQYPYLLTLLLMENQSYIIDKEPVSVHVKTHKKPHVVKNS